MTPEETAKNFFGLLILAGVFSIWVRHWPWETLQLVTITSFAAAGLLMGGWLVPGSRLAEGGVMVVALVVGFFSARWATQFVATAIDHLKYHHASRYRSVRDTAQYARLAFVVAALGIGYFVTKDIRPKPAEPLVVLSPKITDRLTPEGGVTPNKPTLPPWDP